MHGLGLTPLVGEFESPVLAPVGVAVVAESAMLVHGPPLVPAGCRGHTTALACLLAIRCQGNRLILVWDGLWNRTRGSSLAWNGMEHTISLEWNVCNDKFWNGICAIS